MKQVYGTIPEVREMRKIKFRLRNGKNIVGYEWWGGLEWEQSEDGKKWFATCFIPHQEKDQFTGLFDKDGTELYERDIVIDTETNAMYEIAFKHGGFCFDSETEDGFFISRWAKYYRKIGNICEGEKP